MDMIAYCGLDCEACEAYLALKNDDQELREKTARYWAEMYGADINPDDINCTGCKGSGVQISHCGECRIRLCAMERKLENCGHCGDYPCETVSMVISNVPEAKRRLDAVRTD